MAKSNAWSAVETNKLLKNKRTEVYLLKDLLKQSFLNACAQLA